VAKRAEILETALEIIARNGYSGATVKELAEAVGLSQNGLLHYFGSKDALFVEILRRRDEVDQARFSGPGVERAEFVEGLTGFVRHHAEVPGLVQLYSRLSNEASEAAHPAHDLFKQRYAITRETQRESLEQLQRDGRLAPDSRVR
jgi:AcrR family transcriptional regulator